ncbi:MAG TPA: serine/threonine-protein kinase [Gemmatimonadaceae bacterium]|nr:serine/threonine-protein kinase [Gemmatimonadaceae bacterium]
MEELIERLRRSFADEYRLDEELRGGSMSRLFRGTDLSDNRDVVIKVLPPELTSDVMAARFRRETRVTARLRHQNILTVITTGVKDGLMYYVMPYISGESLRDRLDREQLLPIDDCTRILADIAAALSYAHEQGIIHRDIKPENILLQTDNAILADFGVAAALAMPGETAHSRITRTGMTLGTVGYMAPEQAFGDADVDHRADIYALGVVGHEMISGSPPFTGATTQAILAANLTQPPPRLEYLRADVPPRVARAIEKALMKSPADRFQTARDFSAACTTS